MQLVLCVDVVQVMCLLGAVRWHVTGAVDQQQHLERSKEWTDYFAHIHHQATHLGRCCCCTMHRNKTDHTPASGKQRRGAETTKSNV